MEGPARTCPWCRTDLRVLRDYAEDPDVWVRLAPRGWNSTTEPPTGKERESILGYECRRCGKTFRLTQ
jgi:hypothetical protein